MNETRRLCYLGFGLTDKDRENGPLQHDRGEQNERDENQMLTTMRSKAGGWVAKAFIGLLAASFAVWGISDVFRGSRTDTLAEVGNRTISAESFRLAFERRVRSFSRQIGRSLTPAQARELGLDRRVLAEMLQEAALGAQADKMQIAISPKLVAQRIADTPQFQNSRGEFDANQFRQLLVANGLSEQQFLASEGQAMLRQSIQAATLRGTATPDTLLKIAYEHRNEQRDVRYFVIKSDPSKIAEPSDSDLKTFHSENKNLFAIPERRALQLIQVTPQTLASLVTVTDDELKDAYDRRKSEYGTPESRTIQQIAFAAKADAEAALARIKNGEDFVAVAKALGRSENDINLGTFTKGTFPDGTIAEQVFSLPEGQVSEPLAGRLSTMLVRTTKLTEGTQKSFEDVRGDVDSKLRLDKARDLVLDFHDKVEDARAGGQSFTDIAKTLKLDVITTPPLDRDGRDAQGNQPSGMVAMDETLRAAFESDVGVENDVIATQDDGFVWVDVEKIEPAGTRQLSEARDDAVRLWKARKGRTAVLDAAREMRKRLEAGEKLDKLAEEAGTTVQTASGLQRNEASTEFDVAAVQALFRAPRDGFAISADSDGKAAKVIQSIPVLAQPFDANSADAKAIKTVLDQGISGNLNSEFLADLQRELGVTINEQVMHRLRGGQTGQYN